VDLLVFDTRMPVGGSHLRKALFSAARCCSSVAGAGPRVTAEHRRQLAEDGVTVVAGVLAPDFVTELRTVSASLCADPSLAHLQEDAFTGSLIPVGRDAAFAQLVALPAALDVFGQFGWSPPSLRWMSGFVISKPGQSPSLGWHQDGWFWDEQVAYEQCAPAAPAPAQVFAMYYLADTSAANGCLRVLPGSHRAPGHALHAALGRAHSEEVRSASEGGWQQRPEHGEHAGAVDVPVRAGDLVLGDARVLHGARRNSTDERRSLVTLWYMPRFDGLSNRMQQGVSALHQHQCADVRHGWAEGVPHLPGLLPPLVHQGLASDGAGEFDHNLKFMDRTPGFVASASEAAREAYCTCALAIETVESGLVDKEDKWGR